MGLILDTSIVITRERRGLSVPHENAGQTKTFPVKPIMRGRLQPKYKTYASSVADALQGAIPQPGDGTENLRQNIRRHTRITSIAASDEAPRSQ